MKTYQGARDWLRTRVMPMSALLLVALSMAPSFLRAQPAIDITSGAVRTVYQDHVPHTDSGGAFLDSFNPNSSFLPIGLYGVTPDAFASAKQAGFNLAFTSFRLEPLTELPEGSPVRSVLWFQQSSPEYPFIPIVGDVDGNGADEVGLYYRSSFYLDTDTDGSIDILAAAGGDIADFPLLGDWDGDGDDTPGIYRASNRTFYLYMETSGTHTIERDLGNHGDIPLVGDWDGDGKDGVALYRPSTREFFFYDTLQDPPSNSAQLGDFEDIPISGDWNADGIDCVGLYRPATRRFWLYDDVSLPPVGQVEMGNHGDIPLSGDWDGQAGTGIGNYRRTVHIPDSEMRLFYLDNDLDGVPEVGIDLQNPRFIRFRDDPRVLGWQFADEPLGGALSDPDVDPDSILNVLKDQYQFYSPMTAQRVLLVEVPPCPSNMPWWPEYINTMDLGCHDNYPKFLGIELTSLETIALTVSEQTFVLSESKPSWLVTQAFSQTGGGSFQWEMPTPKEAKAMVYAALVHGATGIVHFTWDSWISRASGVVGIAPDPPQVYPQGGIVATPEQLDLARLLWNGIAGVNAELDSMAPVLLSQTSDELYSVFVDATPVAYPIRCLLKGGEDTKYLITVNICSEPLNVRYQFEDAILSPVGVLFEDGRTVLVQSNGFTDYYEGFDVHIYAIPEASLVFEEEDGIHLPSDFELAQNYPNPFNLTTGIKFTVSKPLRAKVEILNLLGQKVRTLVDEHLTAGQKLTTWDGKDDFGEEVSSGIYLYRMKTSEFSETKRMLFLK